MSPTSKLNSKISIFMYKDGFGFPHEIDIFELGPWATLEICSNVIKLHHRASIINRNKNKTIEPAFEKKSVILSHSIQQLA